jgi:anti-anti-sigma factor
LNVSEIEGSEKEGLPVELDIRASDGVAVVEPKGRIDSVTAQAFGERVCALIRAGENRVVIDFANVAYMSSAGFRSLLIVGKTVEQSAGRLALCGVIGEMKRLFDIGGFDQRFVICPTRAESVAKVGPAGS